MNAGYELFVLCYASLQVFCPTFVTVTLCLKTSRL